MLIEQYPIYSNQLFNKVMHFPVRTISVSLLGWTTYKMGVLSKKPYDRLIASIGPSNYH